MNQKLLAGIGNVYSDEILFHARILPQSGVNLLSEKTLRQLFHTLRRVLRKAIECRTDPARFPPSYLLPHRDQDGRCPRCGSPLRVTRVGGRTSYFCPQDQKKKS